MTTSPAPSGPKLASGSSGTSHTLTGASFNAFTAGQTLWLSFFYTATRTTGSGILTLTQKIRWFNSSGTELTATQSSFSIDASVGWTFQEYSHVAPSTAVSGRVEFVASPASSTMQHDLTLAKMRLSKSQTLANYVTNTNQLTDGAGLGTTAVWSSVTGTGKPADNATVNNVTYSSTAPSSPVIGDIWVDTSVNPNIAKVRIGGTGAELLTGTPTAYTGVSWSSGTATCSSAAEIIRWSGICTVGLTYNFSFTYNKTSGAQLRIVNGATNGVNEVYNTGNIGNGTATVSGSFTAAGTYFAIEAAASPYSGTVSSISCKQSAVPSWQAASNYTTNTNQLTDGAALGQTAVWSSITGSGKAADNATVNNVTYATSAPSSPVNGDIWVDTSSTPNIIKVRVSGAWQLAANYTTNTNQLTDGASLGQTAVWNNVTGTGKPADNATVGAVIGPGGNVSGSVDANGLPFIDFSRSSHLNKNLDNISDGSSFARISSTRVNASRPVIDFSETIHPYRDSLFRSNANVVYNGGFRVTSGDDWPLGWTHGSTFGYYRAGDVGPFIYSQTNGTNVCLSDPIPVYAGGTWSIQADLATGACTGGNIFVDVEYYTDASCTTSLYYTLGAGAYSSRLSVALNSGWQRAFTATTAPTGAGGARVRIFTESITFSTGGIAYARRIKFCAAMNGADIPFSDEATNSVNALTIPGTGRRVGDQRNLPQMATQNLRYKFTGTITYSAAAGSPATATISVGAGYSYIGSQTVSYGSMTVPVTGTGGTTTSYWLYLDDANYAGGSQTLVATTTPETIYQNDARVYIGAVDVTFPTSGTGTGGGTGGGGGGNNCVFAGAWVETQNRGWQRAGDVLAGDMLRCLNDSFDDTEWLPVRSTHIAIEPAYKITSERGIELHVSHTTPLTLQDGSYIFPEELEGQKLPIYVDTLEWEPCRAEYAKELPVCYISLGGEVYAAGDVKGRTILTHNPGGGTLKP